MTELLLEGVTVYVYRTSDDMLIGTTTTNINGFYEFLELDPEDYYIVFDETTNVAGLVFVSSTVYEANSSTDITDKLDSDISNDTQRTPDFTLVFGDVKRDIDGGFVTEPLPVEMSYFEGFEKDCSAQLNWGTATEDGNDYFIVEKSINGIDYVQIGEVDGAGTTAEAQHYYFIDERLRDEFNYYRLKQVDFDGAFEYSDVVTVRLDRDSKCLNDLGDAFIFPNPTKGDVRFEVELDGDAESVKFQLTDVLGRLVAEEVHDLKEGYNMIEMDFGKMSVGTYFLNVSYGARNNARFKIVIIDED